MTHTVGKMTRRCASIRGKQHKHEQCTAPPGEGSEWCGRHKTSQVRYIPPTPTIQHVPPPPKAVPPEGAATALATKVYRVWGRWIARRCGPLLHNREESNNPFDFFSSDPIEEIPMQDFISFVDAGKGYIMDIKSAISLVEHATTAGETPLNPFNRAPLPPLFLQRMTRHRGAKTWTAPTPISPEQAHQLAVTDTFRAMEDLGYYTDPSWYTALTRVQLQQLYIELADIWMHRANLGADDRKRIVPSTAGRPFSFPVPTVLIMAQKALQPMVLNTCRLLVSSAVARSDRQLGVMYVLGALSIISPSAGMAFPWLVDMFTPGATRVVNGALAVMHPSVYAY
jgi:hypothetical protein